MISDEEKVMDTYEETACNATKVCIAITLVIFFNLGMMARMLNTLITNCVCRIIFKFLIFFMPIFLTYWIMVVLREVKMLDCMDS